MVRPVSDSNTLQDTHQMLCGRAERLLAFTTDASPLRQSDPPMPTSPADVCACFVHDHVVLCRAPFLLGSCLFITSALLSLRDCQGNWGTAKPSLRSWWMHVLNLVGSIGFWLCSFFGFFAHPAERFQRWGMAFSCLWGSCCFAVAAFLQLLLTWVPEAAQFG